MFGKFLLNFPSFLLFDEIEKAHSTVFDKFLQILEDGRLTDGQGQTAYFNQSIIIFTSNIGASTLFQEKVNLQSKDYDEIEDYSRKESCRNF